MMSKLIDLFMDCEIFNPFVLNAPFLYPLKTWENWSGPIQASNMELFPKIVSKINLKPLILLAKVHLRWFARSRMYLCKWIQQVLKLKWRYLPNSLYLKVTSVNYLSKSQPWKQLSKVSVWWSSQECLFGNVSANYYQRICRGVFYWSSLFSAHPLEQL